MPVCQRHTGKNGKLVKTYTNPQQKLKRRSNFFLKLSSDSHAIISSGKRFRLSITLLEKVYFPTLRSKQGLNNLRLQAYDLSNQL